MQIQSIWSESGANAAVQSIAASPTLISIGEKRLDFNVKEAPNDKASPVLPVH